LKSDKSDKKQILLNLKKKIFVLVVIFSACVFAESGAASSVLEEADNAFSSGDYGRAAWLYYKVKQQFPDAANVCVSLGYTYLKLGWPRYAGGEFSKALELSGRTNALAWLGLGTYYARTNDWKLAELCFVHARTYNPDNPAVYRKLGNVFFYSGQHSKAAENYLYAAARGDKNDELYPVIGLCYERCAQWPKAVEAYERAYKLNNKNDYAVWRLMLLYRDRFKDVSNTKRYYQLLLELNPNLAKAEAKAFEKRMNQSKTRKEELINIEKEKVVVKDKPRKTLIKKPVPKYKHFESLAYKALSNELPKEALSYFQKALDTAPKQYQYNLEIAKIYDENLDQLQLSLRYYDKFLAECPKDNPQLGQVISTVKKVRERFNKIEEDERNRRQKKEEDARKIAEAEKQRKEELQRKELEEAQKEPQDYESVLAKGVAFLNDKNFDEARKYFQKANHINSAYPNAYYNLGLVYASEKNYKESAKYFKRALEKNPEFALAHLALGTVYNKLDETENAINHFNYYLELSPNAKNADTVRAWLTKNAGAR